ARLRDRQAAHKDADEALARDFGPATQYQVAGIFALTSQQEAEDRSEALRYLSSALRKGVGFDYLEQDRDLDPIRERPEFRQLVSAARSLPPAAPKKQGKPPAPLTKSPESPRCPATCGLATPPTWFKAGI